MRQSSQLDLTDFLSTPPAEALDKATKTGVAAVKQLIGSYITHHWPALRDRAVAAGEDQLVAALNTCTEFARSVFDNTTCLAVPEDPPQKAWDALREIWPQVMPTKRAVFSAGPPRYPFPRPAADATQTAWVSLVNKAAGTDPPGAGHLE